MKALVTGHAGFVGFHVSRRLLAEGWDVIGIDAFTDYYDVTLKERRTALLDDTSGFTGIEGRIETPGLLSGLMAEHRPDAVIHLAAQAGVRASIETPRPYAESNLMGTFELLEAIRAHPPRHTLMASTSSVYGANTEMPYAETHKADHPVSFYAATKKANEAMAHSYSHLYDLPITLFRFFTVYGPWGRPDMALFKFTKAILEGKPIDVYNHGKMRRDFTYIDDLIEAVARLIAHPAPATGSATGLQAPYRIINIGSNTPVNLMDFIESLERTIGRPAQKNLSPHMSGDMTDTWADVSKLREIIGYVPDTPIDQGVGAFVDWYADYYKTTLPR
ncbi:MAG: NAD-dependent epimerase/dehydratase family protein [Pseudomonadota bacterium]